MKKKIFTLLAAVVALTLNAQNITTPVIETFESEPYTLSNMSVEGNIGLQVVENPQTEGLNNSAKCIELTVIDGYDWWHKVHLKPADGIYIEPASDKHVYFHFKCMRTGLLDVDAELWLLPPSGNEAEKLTQYQFKNSEANVWEEFVVDLTDALAAGQTIADIRIQPCPGRAEANVKYYFDDFQLLEGEPAEEDNFITTPEIEDFESEPYTLSNISVEGNLEQAIVENPVNGGINASSKCVQLTIKDGYDWWHKLHMKPAEGMSIKPASDKHVYFHFKSMRTGLTQVDSELWLLDPTGSEATKLVQYKFKNSEANVWEEFVVDLTDALAAGQTIANIRISPCPSYAEANVNFYFDDFELTDNPNPEFISTPEIEDYESEPYTLSNMSVEGNIGLQVVENPQTEGLNNSAKCIELTVIDGYDWWHKAHLKPADGMSIKPASGEHVYFHFKSMRTGLLDTDSELWLLDPTGSENNKLVQYKFRNTQLNVWEDFVIDLTEAFGAGKTIADVRIQPCPSYAEANVKFYFDDFKLTTEALPEGANLITTPMIETFESEPYNLSNISYEGGATTSVVENSYNTGINQSAKCLQVATAANHNWWDKVHIKPAAGCYVKAASKSHVYFHFKGLRSRKGDSSELVILGSDNSELVKIQFNNTEANVWEDFVVDLTDAVAADKMIANIRIQPELNFNNAVPETTYLFDDFQLIEQDYPDGIELKTVSEIVNFDDEALTAENIKEISVVAGEGASCAVVANPQIESLLNKTEKVLSYNKPANATWWHALKLGVNGLIKVEAPNTYLHVEYNAPDGSAARVIVKDYAGNEVRSEITPAVADAWEDFVINLGEIKNMQSIEFLFGFAGETNWANPAGTFYVDEIVLNHEATPRTLMTSVEAVKAAQLLSYAENGVLYVATKELAKVAVYAVNGMKVAEAEVAENASFALPQGVYIVRAVVAGEVVTDKVVVK